MSHSHGKWLVVPAAALLLLLGACGDNGEDTSDEGDGGGTPVTVVATDFAFDTETLTLEAGESVELTLQNDGEAEHSFTSEDVGAEVEAEPGATASTTFTAPDEDGTFEFHCEYHPTQMIGEIVVGEGGAAGSGSEETDTTESEDTTEGSSENDDGDYDY
jgi:plastocyanin